MFLTKISMNQIITTHASILEFWISNNVASLVSHIVKSKKEMKASPFFLLSIKLQVHIYAVYHYEKMIDKASHQFHLFLNSNILILTYLCIKSKQLFLFIHIRR
jgi:hypothetical protein